MVKRVGIWTILIIILFLVSCSSEYQGTLPVMIIESDYDPFTMDRELWHDGIISISGTEDYDFANEKARLRGRGNSTWWLGEDKRPLRFRFEEERSLMGSDYEATDWILLANLFDKSLIRNYSALTLAGNLDGLDFTPVPHHMHLYVNGEYMGVYLLVDERDVNEGRLELEFNIDPTISDYFFELDIRSADDVEDIVVVNGWPYDVRFPSASARTQGHMSYLQTFIQTVSDLIRVGDLDEITNWIDMDSFVDFYIVQELFKNTDAYFTSIFMHIKGQGEDRRLFMGPVWDFDLCAGNVSGLRMGHGPEHLHVAIFNYWYRYLMDIDEFRERVRDRWNEVKYNEISETLWHVRNTVSRYRLEFERNFERHDVLTTYVFHLTPSELVEIDNFIGHANHFQRWMVDRINWLDDYFNGRTEGYDSLMAFVELHEEVIVFLDNERVETENPVIILNDRVLFSKNDILELFESLEGYIINNNEILIYGDDYTIKHIIGTGEFEINNIEYGYGKPFSLRIGDQIFLPIWAIVEGLTS